MSLSVSRHLSRARALSLLEEKKTNRTKLLDEGRNEGLYIEHRLAKATSVHKDVELSKAFIFSKKFFRNDRKTQEKQYYVIGATCKIHADNDSIVLSRLDRFHRNASPCLLCMSSNDVLGIASIQSNIKRDTLYAQTRRGLPASEVVKLALRKKALLENKNPRAPAIRDKSHYMKDLSVYEKFQAKLGSYTQGDPRREKLKKLLDNFDFSEAVVSK
jgi:hypothetical protein